MKIIAYRNIRQTFTRPLDEQVNELIRGGWEPLGPCRANRYGDPISQTMVKYEEK